MVGDSAIDILTARHAGARAIGVLWGYDRSGVLRERPDALVETPSGLRSAVLFGYGLARSLVSNSVVLRRTRDLGVDPLESEALEGPRRILRRPGDQDLPGPRGVLAQLARGIHLPPEDIQVSDPEHLAVTDSDAEQDFRLRGPRPARILNRPLHGDRATYRRFGTPEDHDEGVRFDLDQNPVVGLKDRREKLLVLVDDLQEVQDPELLHLAGESGEIGEHHGPGLSEEVPDLPVEGGRRPAPRGPVPR